MNEVSNETKLGDNVPEQGAATVRPKNGLPLPKLVTAPRHWLMGPAYYAQRAPLHWIPKWIGEHGDIFRVSSPFGQATILGAPELARQVLVDRYPHYQKKSQSYVVLRILMGDGLVTSEGEYWRTQRRLAQPAFHRRKIDALFALMVQRVTACVEEIAARAGSDQAMDFCPLLSKLTLDIIAAAMFSSDLCGAAADVPRHIAVLNEYALEMLRKPWLFLLPRRFPTPFNYRPYRSLRLLKEIVGGIIQARRRATAERDDLLGMLLAARDEATQSGLSDAQLHDEVMTIFVAGHETTANAMAWVLHLVARHPEVEERLLAEIDAHWNDGGLSLERLGAFVYTRQVIEESLRLYPTIWSIGRQCTREDELGGCRIPAGMNVVIPIFHFHRSGRFWAEPEKFDPDRFSAERRPAADTMTYFPFGAGPRTCIGNHFALQELMIMTVLLHRHFRFRLQPGFTVTAEPLITLRPKLGMRMTIQKLSMR